MRGYSIMSDEERQNIISQHKSFYNGYAVGNVPSNMTPLTVYDAAQDKGGVNVNNRGEVSQYANHQINEAKVEKDLVDEIEADDMDVSDVQSAYDFDSKGPEQFDHSYSDDSYDLDLGAIMQMFGGSDGHEMMRGERRAYDFDSDGGNVDVYGESKMSDKERAWEDFLELNPSINSKTIHGARKHFEDMWSKTNMSEEEGEGHNHEIKEQGIKFSPEVFPDVGGWERPNKGLGKREETAVMYKKDNVTVTFRQNQADENKIEISVVGNNELKEKLAGSIKRNELQDKINIFKQWAESLNEEVVEKEMCEQCGAVMSEGECSEQCGMYKEMDSDLHESFKTQKDRITEMFNRFKNYN
jgi:hypothetical protein